MNKLTKENKIENMIYEIRGREVMLDSDLARLYECKNGTKDINKAVKRNLDKFPIDFYFQLELLEYENLKFQNGTSSLNTYGGIRKLPHVFTEQGVAMLATVIHTSVAAEISVKIMRAFVAMRHYIMNSTLVNNNYNYNDLLINMDNRISDNSNKIKLIENTLYEMNKKEKVNTLFFEGQIYDAYSLLRNIFDKASKEIIIIDNYIDRHLLDVLKDTNKKIIIYTNKYNNEDYLKYKKEYSNVELIINNNFHDRFIILDKSILYHSGASFKDLGSKCFAINEIEDKEILNILLNHIERTN